MKVTRAFLSVAAIGLLMTPACAPGEIGGGSNISDEELALFLNSSARNGDIAGACTELNNLCSTEHKGCTAYSVFCQPATSDRMCRELKNACSSGKHPSACTAYQTRCSATKADGGVPSPQPDSSVVPGQDSRVTPVRDSSVTPVRDSRVTPVRDASVTPIKDASVTPIRDASVTPVQDSSVTPTGHFSLLPVRSALPSGADCAARVRRASWEPRPQNNTANHTTGKTLTVDSGIMRAAFASRIDGNFTGTTDEIIQWGACKWGFDEDYVRAQAVTESNWIQSAVGDNGESYGLLQVRMTAHANTFPTSRDSTAFNVDYTLAARRSCFEGDITWLNTVDHTGTYAAGDEWGCAGVWYSGRWMTSDATYYIGVMRGHLTNKPWLQSGF